MRVFGLLSLLALLAMPIPVQATMETSQIPPISQPLVTEGAFALKIV